MRILVAEGDRRIVNMLAQYLDSGRHEAVAFVNELPVALRIAKEERPDLAIVGSTLADHSTGYFVASELKRRDVPSVFVCPSRLPFAIPELALGWLKVPFTQPELTSFLDVIAASMTAPRALNTISPNFQIYRGAFLEPAYLQ